MKDELLDFLRAGSQPRADRSKLESPLEDMFIGRIEKYLSPKVEIIPQFEIVTICGKFRLDFVVKLEGLTVCFECDGKDFHDEWRDEWRDGLILETGIVNSIFRLRGKDIHAFINDIIGLIFHYERRLFSDRYGEIYAHNMISDVMKEYIMNGASVSSETNEVQYEVLDEEEKLIRIAYLRVLRRTLSNQYHWNRVLRKYAVSNKGKKIEQIMELRKNDMKRQ